MFKISTPCRYSEVRFAFDMDDERFHCFRCKLQKKEPLLFGKPVHMDWKTGTVREAVEHLKHHYSSGRHKVPIIAFERLLRLPQAKAEGLIMTQDEFWGDI